MLLAIAFTGSYNTGTGNGALNGNTMGGSSSTYGASALTSNTTGGGNTVSGYSALYNTTPSTSELLAAGRLKATRSASG